MGAKNQTIEVDGATAAALKERAAERGVSIAELVAELVPLAIGDAAIADGPPSSAASRRCRTPKSSAGCVAGEVRISGPGMSDECRTVA
jgi:hypothetical protein